MIIDFNGYDVEDWTIRKLSVVTKASPIILPLLENVTRKLIFKGIASNI